MSRFKTAPVENNTSDWKIMRRKGSKVRYQNMVSGAWDRWETDPDYVRPFLRTVVDTYNANAKGESIYGKMTVAELRSLAGNRGIKVPSKARKSEIISALTN